MSGLMLFQLIVVVLMVAISVVGVIGYNDQKKRKSQDSTRH